MQDCKNYEKSRALLPNVDDKLAIIEPHRKLNRLIKMFETYIDNYIRICFTFFASDFIYRLYLFIWEYKYYFNRYVNLSSRNYSPILGRCFSYGKWKICAGAILLVFLLRIASTRQNPLVLTDVFYFPLYWVFRIFQSPHSNLDYANWIRAPYGLDYGEGMASSYFHGYLKLVMPSHTGDRGIRERIALYTSQHNVEFVTDKLVILIPNIMYVPPKIESRILEKATPLETVIKNRAGVFRPYKTDVYRFTEKINDKFYYIAMEGATPLLTFYEAMNSNYTSTWQMREMQREILFKFSQSIKKMINEYPGTQNEIEIVLYNAHTADGENQDIGDVIKAHFEKRLQGN